MIRIWGRVNSVNVQKVLWALAELDLAYERTDAGLEFGVVDSPAYRTMNPNALVPTMDDDGFVLGGALTRHPGRTTCAGAFGRAASKGWAWRDPPTLSRPHKGG